MNHPKTLAKLLRAIANGTQAQKDNHDVILNAAAYALERRAAIDNADKARQGVLIFAVSRWNAEVKNRPLRNVHRRTLDDTWRQVIRFAGGDDVSLCGPVHDDLVI